MKIKDHFSIVIWPPVWTTRIGDESPPPGKSEELMLRKVELVYRPHIDASHGYLLLSAELGHETKTRTSLITGKTITSTKPGKTYTGMVTILRDPEFLEQLYQKLQNSIGQTIREIEDSEIEST